MKTRLIRYVLLVLPLTALGCLPDVWTWPLDLNDSLQEETFVVDEDCQVEGGLEIELGVGERVFRPLSDGQSVDVHFGSQGGSHLFFAARIQNENGEPFLSQYAEFEAVFELLNDELCSEEALGLPDWLTPFMVEDRECYPVSTGHRVGVWRIEHLNDDLTQLEMAGIFVVHAVRGGGGTNRIRFSVQDKCGRTASVNRRIVER